MVKNFAVKKRISIIMSIVLVIGILVGSGSLCSEVYAATTAKENVSLNVALYGYVPDPQRFEQAVTDKWALVQPNVDLNFVSWDSYESDPPENLDVFVFDAIYLSHFIEEEYLLPLSMNEVQDSADILPFALDGCTVSGNVYAIPQIVCTNLLYTRANDQSLSGITTVNELYNSLGNRKCSQIIPKKNKGLLIDMSGGTTQVCMYLDALIDTTQTYTDYYSFPDLNNLNTNALNSLLMLQKMAGAKQANYWPDNDDAYIRAQWFENGHGKAYIGYTEAMSKMEEFAHEVEFKTISLSESNDIPLFYGDVVGVNSKIDNKDKKELAIQLTNIITAKDTLVQAISPDSDNIYPQYLLPARNSVYAQLNSDYPIYGKLQEIATNSNNKLFKVGPNIRTWMTQAKPVFKQYLETH